MPSFASLVMGAKGGNTPAAASKADTTATATTSGSAVAADAKPKIRTIGQAGTRLNYKLNEEAVGPPPRKSRERKEELLEQYEADHLGMKPPDFVLSTSTESSKFIGSSAVMLLSNSGSGYVGGKGKMNSLPPANIISASGVRTINFTKDELPGDWNSATKLNRREIAGTMNTPHHAMISMKAQCLFVLPYSIFLLFQLFEPVEIGMCVPAVRSHPSVLSCRSPPSLSLFRFSCLPS